MHNCEGGCETIYKKAMLSLLLVTLFMISTFIRFDPLFFHPPGNEVPDKN
jgi:hypothetical protein